MTIDKVPVNHEAANPRKKIVSVIVTSYNHARYLQQRIETIYSQDYSWIDVIVIDDCSNDGTQTLLHKMQARYGFRLEILNQRTGTPYQCWQTGLNLASGDYIWIAESDDYSSPRFLTKAVDALHISNAEFVYAGSIVVNEKSEVVGNAEDQPTIEDAQSYFNSNARTIEGVDFITGSLSTRNCIPNVSAVLFRADSLKAKAEYITSFRYAGDWYLYLMLCSRGSVAYISERLNYFREHPETTRRRERGFTDYASYLLELKTISTYLQSLNLRPTKNISRAISKLEEALSGMVRLKYTSDLGRLYGLLCDRESRLVIYGFGDAGRSLLRRLSKRLPSTITCLIVDKSAGSSYIHEWEGAVISPLGYSKIARPSDLIIVASFSSVDEIKRDIRKLKVAGRVISLSSIL